MMLISMRADMRTTITIDDELFNKALELAEPGQDKSDLVRECVKTFVRVQAARRLADLGGKIPDMTLPPRRREKPTKP
jgi:Arc/MetJ family transcription regulator